jgi:hypothetical protein
MNLMNTLRALLIAIGGAMLVVIFQAYLKPGFIIDIANQLFLCL